MSATISEKNSQHYEVVFGLKVHLSSGLDRHFSSAVDLLRYSGFLAVKSHLSSAIVEVSPLILEKALI